MASKTQSPPAQKHSSDKYPLPSYPSALSNQSCSCERWPGEKTGLLPLFGALPGEDLQRNQTEISIYFPPCHDEKLLTVVGWLCKRSRTQHGWERFHCSCQGGCKRTSISKVISQFSVLVWGTKHSNGNSNSKEAVRGQKLKQCHWKDWDRIHQTHARTATYQQNPVK